VELSYCEIEALELLAADCETEKLELLAADCEAKALELVVAAACELKLTTVEEAADKVFAEPALLDLVLEATDPDEELAVCAEAAYSLTSVVSRPLAWTEAARITRKKDPSKLTTAIWTRLWPSIAAEQVIPSSRSNEQVKGTESSLFSVLSKTL
jgi:hypothetical protein